MTTSYHSKPTFDNHPISDSKPLKNSKQFLWFSAPAVEKRVYAPKPLDTSAHIETYSAIHQSPPQIPTSFLSSKTRKLLSANNHFVCVNTSTKTLFYSWRSGSLVWEDRSPATSAVFDAQGSSIWLGTKSGAVVVKRTADGAILHTMNKCHLKPITYTAATKHGIVTFSSEDGKICVWNTNKVGDIIQVQRVPAKTELITTGGYNSPFLWTCKDRRISIHNIIEPLFTVKSISVPVRGANLGKIVSVTAYGDVAYFGQNDGLIAVFKGAEFIGSLNGGINSITALSATSDSELWAATKSGRILVFSVNITFSESYNLKASLLRQWPAHSSSIKQILLAQTRTALLSFDGNGTTCAWNTTPSDILPASASSNEGFVVNIVTWNIGSSTPNEANPSDFIGEWVLKSDFIAIGLQEVINLEKASHHAINMVTSIEAEPSHEHEKWQDLIEMLLIPFGFTLIKAKSLVGIMIILFVKRKNASSISDMDVKLVRCGIGGTYGNKGAIAVNLKMSGMTWCFTNCHLAAGHSAIVQRNRDAMQIVDTVGFHSDVCFFFGDTNYRISAAKEQAQQSIRAQNWGDLRRMDQLATQISKIPSFCLGRFQEGLLNFPPTYKYNRGTNVYDTSEKQRVPSWCDRILFRGKSIQVLQYEHIETATASDHKPVVGTYLVPQLVSNQY